MNINNKLKGMKELDYATANNTNYLYTSEYNLVDFNVDDNGLWVIYSIEHSNNTIVSMLNPTTLETLYSLNISINHHKVLMRGDEKGNSHFFPSLSQIFLFFSFLLF